MGGLANAATSGKPTLVVTSLLFLAVIVALVVRLSVAQASQLHLTKGNP